MCCVTIFYFCLVLFALEHILRLLEHRFLLAASVNVSFLALVATEFPATLECPVSHYSGSSFCQALQPGTHFHLGADVSKVLRQYFHVLLFILDFRHSLRHKYVIFVLKIGIYE